MQAAVDLHASVSGSVSHAANALYTVADGAASQVVAAAASVADQANGGIAAANTAAAATASQGGGPFGFLTDAFESILRVLEGGLSSANVPYSYGFAIILLTLLVKLATFPLSKKSMESTMAMQALQPRVKELQARFANDPENLQLETARLYKEAGVNPLAGCLPTLATIPVFIGLYRALSKAADDGVLTQGFFWIPSLGGPTTLTARQAGSGLAWLFPFVDGAPPIGWHDAISYLALPVLLVISQFVSQKFVSPQSKDPAQQQTQAILKFIPFMIGWFSLNVPSGLTLYWFVNNIISTAQQIYMKNTIQVAMPAGPGGATIDVSASTISPKEERVKKLTGKELGARKKAKDESDATTSSAAAASNGSASSSSSSSNDGRGQKFRARKARDAAAKARASASQGGADSNGAQREAEVVKAGSATSELDKVRVPDAPPSRD